MSKRLFKTMVAVLAIAAAAAGPVRGQNANPDVTLDFTSNDWNIPTSNTTTTESYTDGTYSITLSATYAYKFTSGYLLLGKSGSYLELPEFESAVEKIEVVGNSAASGSVNQNIYVGGTAVSTQTTGAKGTNTYVINENYRAAGNIYTLKVENAYNTQITYIKVYYVSSGGGSTPEPEPEPAVPHTVRMAEGTEEAANWSLASGGESVPGNQVLENVMSGSELTATYNGTQKVKSVKAVKYVAPVVPNGPSLATPLTIEAITAGNILVNMDANLPTGMKYSVNGGEKTLINNTTTIEVNAGDKVQFYGNGTSTTEYGNYPEVKLKGTAETKVYGNIMSLLDETGYETATTLSGEYVFYALFLNNTNLKDASGLLLPAMTLANHCYANMFHGCTGLTEAPALPAPTLVSGCYYSMFYGCNNLASVTCLATSGINASGSTGYWLDGAGSNVTGTKTFTAVSTAEWPTSVNGIPEGWTRVNQ